MLYESICILTWVYVSLQKFFFLFHIFFFFKKDSWDITPLLDAWYIYETWLHEKHSSWAQNVTWNPRTKWSWLFLILNGKVQVLLLILFCTNNGRLFLFVLSIFTDYFLIKHFKILVLILVLKIFQISINLVLRELIVFDFLC